MKKKLLILLIPGIMGCTIRRNTEIPRVEMPADTIRTIGSNYTDVFNALRYYGGVKKWRKGDFDGDGIDDFCFEAEGAMYVTHSSNGHNLPKGYEQWYKKEK